ncbi:MAG: UDP-glucose/GDP-mannose dehydrogenase family protein [bacterium]|nr:UDP-glucose/GDP-mannose dehydrogenase family protein [bacterium]MCY3653093.1 UDP-glucose/GDP-mannose dehydrogenase family protein [bacterium]MDE0643605.1 UDP-glucose/GDP-mannose dehydrogenase family protein [bacterium]
MRVAVIGAGYVGVTQAAGLAHLGHEVRVGERDENRLTSLRSGRIPFFEPGLEDLVSAGLAQERLGFYASNRKAVEGASVVFITLPTPTGEDGGADMSILDQAVSDLASDLEPGAALAIKSTVPPGTVLRLSRLPEIIQKKVAVQANPEFLREGSAVADFLQPDRIVIGSTDREQAERLADEVYGPLPGKRIMVDPTSAEMIKYASNAYLATRLTFANSIANLCEEIGADAASVLEGIGHDHRIGPHYLAPGPGYGGSCLPKDVSALHEIARQHGHDLQLLATVMEVNGNQRRRIFGKVARALCGEVSGSTVGLWGLSFKADTDDIRHSPAVDIAVRLTRAGANVQAYDPQAEFSLPGLELVADPLAAAAGADALLIATEWEQFRQVDWGRVRELMRGSEVVDARNLVAREVVEAAGLCYQGVGRGVR